MSSINNILKIVGEIEARHKEEEQARKAVIAVLYQESKQGLEAFTKLEAIQKEIRILTTLKENALANGAA